METKKKTVYVPMAADTVHPGHLNIINISASLGRVVVGLFTDEAIASYKKTPVMNYEMRKTVILGLKGVDEVIPQTSRDYEPNLRLLRPDYMVHGTDWKTGPLSVVRQKAIDIMSEWGGEVVEPEYTQGVSSSELRKKNTSLGLTSEEKRKLFTDQLRLKEHFTGMTVYDVLSTRIAGSAQKKIGNEPLRDISFLWAEYQELSEIYSLPHHPALDVSEYLQLLETFNNISEKALIAEDMSEENSEQFLFLLRESQKKGLAGLCLNNETLPEEKLRLFVQYRIHDNFHLFLKCSKKNLPLVTKYNAVLSGILLSPEEWGEETPETNLPAFFLLNTDTMPTEKQTRRIYRQYLYPKMKKYMETECQNCL